MTSFIISTPVWGESHLDLFLRIGLPSLLSSGNLPALAAPGPCQYFVYTRESERETLEAAATFRRLREVMPTEIIPIETDGAAPHRIMSDCHIDSLKRADETGAAAVFIPPDCVWADGSFRRVGEIAQTSKSMIHMSGIRLDRDSVLPSLLPFRSPDGATLSIDARRLVQIGLDHLHPIAERHFWAEKDGDLMPANLMWTVPGEGLLLRCFHLHPLMVKSQVRFATFGSTIDDDMALAVCPDVEGDIVVTDSDEILAFEMSGLDRIVGTVCPKASVEGVAAWAEFGANARHRRLIGNVIRVHHCDMTPQLWAEREADSEKVVNGIAFLNSLSARELLSKSREVLAARFYASDHPIARAVKHSFLFMRGAEARISRAVFFHHERPRFPHPSWLVWRSTVSALLQVFDGAEDRAVVLGADPSMIAKLKEANPHLTVFDGAPRPPCPVDVAVAIDLDDGSHAAKMAALKELACSTRRRVVLGSSAQQAAGDMEFQRIGGPGTQFCQTVQGWCRAAYRAVFNRRPVWARMLLKLAAVVLSPLILALLAVVGLVINILGLGMDRMFASRTKAAKPGALPLFPA